MRARLVWPGPILKLVDDLRQQASTLRDVYGPAVPEARISETLATRIEAALEEAASGEWLPLEDAARLLGIRPDTLRNRCREHYRPRKLARKEGGYWYVHVRVVGAGPEQGGGC